MIFNMLCSSAKYALIKVSFPKYTEECVCSCGNETLRATSTELNNLRCFFEVSREGPWIIECTNGTDTVQETITVSEGEAAVVELNYVLQLLLGDDECKATTGGWRGKASGFHTAYYQKSLQEELTTEGVKLTLDSSTSGYSYVGAYITSQKIDVSKYSTLRFQASNIPKIPSSFATFQIGLVREYEMADSLSPAEPIVCENLECGLVDISEVTGYWHIMIAFWVRIGHTPYTCDVNDIRLIGKAESEIKVSSESTHIYGIKHDIYGSSPEWVRTDDAAALYARSSRYGSTGYSDFDNCYPWNAITRETLSTGDVMVKIPKFWYYRYEIGDVEYIKIADTADAGFKLHPAFNHGGVETDYIYVGAYKTSEGNVSASGMAPLVSQTRATTRTNAKGKGEGWGIIDISTVSAIQMLILVEFANNDVQSVIGRGYCDGNSAACNTGTCDSVPNLTGRPAGTDGKIDVVWRGIEGFWGNVYEWVDGINSSAGISTYVCNDPSKYGDDNYTDAGYTYVWGLPTGEGYIELESLVGGEEGSEYDYVFLPWTVGNAGIVRFCDYYKRGGAGNDYSEFRRGGAWSEGDKCGLFAAKFNVQSTADKGEDTGSRLLYIPSTTT